MTTPAYGSTDPTTSSPTQQQPSVADFYQQYLGRAPDQGGLDFWNSTLSNGQNSMADVQNAIQNSQEGQKYAINQAYQQDLGRQAEQGGLDYWMNALQNGSSLSDVQNAIGNSQEAQTYKANNPSPSGLVPAPDNTPQNNNSQPIDFQTLYDQLRQQQQASPSYNPNVPQPVFAVPSPQEQPSNSQPIDFQAMYDQLSQQYQASPSYNPNFPQPVYGALPQTSNDGMSGFLQNTVVGPVADFVKNINQQPGYLQRAFQEQLSRLGDPVAAGRAVLNSLR